jgi:hypothetical protein
MRVWVAVLASASFTFASSRSDSSWLARDSSSAAFCACWFFWASSSSIFLSVAARYCSNCFVAFSRPTL